MEIKKVKCSECRELKECIELIKGFPTCEECDDNTFGRIKDTKVIKSKNIVDNQ